MKKFYTFDKGIILFVYFFILFSCRDDSLKTCHVFKYDSSTGTCKDGQGNIGYNALNLVKIRSTKNAECVALHKLEMLLLLHDTTNISSHFAYEVLKDYNFKGSVLDSCQLFFNFVKRSDFRGTDLTTLQYGYASVIGLKDRFTKLPLTGAVIVKDDSIYCFQ